MSNDPKDLYTPAQIEMLERFDPNAVRVDAETGQKVPLLTRQEVRDLVQRFPSCFRSPAPPARREADDPTLAHRFPTMFPRKT